MKKPTVSEMLDKLESEWQAHLETCDTYMAEEEMTEYLLDELTDMLRQATK